MSLFGRIKHISRQDGHLQYSLKTTAVRTEVIMKPILRPVQIKLIVSTLTLMMMMMMMKMRMTNLTPTFLAK